MAYVHSLMFCTHRIAVRGVAGAHLYSVLIDGGPVAVLEDRQTEVRTLTC